MGSRLAVAALTSPLVAALACGGGSGVDSTPTDFLAPQPSDLTPSHVYARMDESLREGGDVLRATVTLEHGAIGELPEPHDEDEQGDVPVQSDWIEGATGLIRTEYRRGDQVRLEIVMDDNTYRVYRGETAAR